LLAHGLYDVAGDAQALVLGSLAVEWAVYAVRSGFRGQALAALGIALGLGLAFLNGLWYLVDQLPFGPGAHPYATVVHALLLVPFALGGVVCGAVVFTLLRAAGHQLTGPSAALPRVAAWSWHLLTVGWVVVHLTVFVTK
jgi:heme/copper-type cytochrome/quinol oxidase subunit 3